MEDTDDVHDIFRLTPNSLDMHVAISKASDQMQERAKSESNWVDDLQKEKDAFKVRLDQVIKNHNIPLLRMEAHISAFSLQGDANESKHNYIRELNHYMKLVREKRKPLMEKYANSAKRYTGKQMEELIEGDLAEIYFATKTLEDHISYLDGIASMMVNITFSMKYFKDLDDYTRK